MPRAKLPPPRGAPRLWNAKRRIKTNRALLPSSVVEYKKNPDSTAWRHQTSPDVVDFIDKAKQLHKPLLPEQMVACLRNPSTFFSRPSNVVPELRKQVYLYD
jgi:hypothetical protein